MIYFTHPLLLLTLMIAPLFLAGAWCWQRNVARRLQRFSRHAQPFPPRSRLQLILVSLALLLLAIACAGPRWGRSTETFQAKLRNVIVAVDISRSMLAQDIRPCRLEYVKADIHELIDSLQDDRMGLLAFKGVGELLCPLTSDKSYLHDCVNRLTVEHLPPGETNLATAIDTALQSFAVAQTSHNVLLLISDGEQLSGEALDAADRAKAANVPIFTIGIGDARGTPLVIDGVPVKWEGKPVTSALDESTLKAIATRSKGRYIPLATSHLSKTSLVTIYQRYLSQLDAQLIAEQREHAFTDRTWLFTLTGLLFLFAAATLSLGRIPWARRATTLLFLFATLSASAGTPERQAQSAYQKGHYLQAIDLYTEALADPTLSTETRAHYAYNKALALWKAGQRDTALKTLSLATESPKYLPLATALEAQLYYELEQHVQPQPPATPQDGATPEATGPTPQERLEKRQATIAAYTRALQADPLNPHAKENLARVSRDLPQLLTEARKARVTEAYQSQPLQQLVASLKDEQRRLIQAPPVRAEDEPLEDYLQRTSAFATALSEQADRCFYLTECAPEHLRQLLFPPTETDLSEEDRNLRQQALEAILTHAKTSQQSLEQLANRYRALESSPDPLLQDEAIAHDIWNTIATPESRLDEAIALQKHINTNDIPLYHRHRDIRAEKKQQATIVTEAVDQLLQQPQPSAQTPSPENATPTPPTLSEEDKAQLNQLNTALKQQLNTPETPEANQQTLDTMEAIRKILAKLQPPQQNQQNQEQQNQQNQDQQEGQQNQQEQQNQQGQQQEGQNASAQEKEGEESEEQTSSAQETPPSEEERKAAQARAEEAAKKLEEMLKQQEIEAILQKAEERAEALEEAKRSYLNRRAPRILKDW